MIVFIALLLLILCLCVLVLTLVTKKDVNKKQGVQMLSSKMISLSPVGGLGNQLFQIWTLIHTANKEDLPFYIESKKNPHTASKKHPRVFYWDTFLEKLKPFVKKTKGQGRYVSHKEQGFWYSPLLVSRNKSTRLKGYFQSYKYFEEGKNKIYDFLEIREKKEHILNKFPKDFFKNTVSLHFRIGDYKSSYTSSIHQVLPLTYYINALKKLVEEDSKKEWRVLYFYEPSDSSDVQNNITNLRKLFPTIVFEEIDLNLADWEEMLVMSLCQHNIIANSTFSWWGAYLNTNRPNVYYPSQWFNGPKNNETNDLCPDHWISTSVQSYVKFPDIAKFKDIHAGEVAVIMGTGKTLKEYIPIANAIHLTCNHFGTLCFCSDKNLIADYYFLSDKPGLDENPGILTYRPKKAKFYGRFQHDINFGPIPSYKNRIDKAEIPYITYDNDDWIETGKGREHEWTLWQKDLSQYPFGGTSTTILKVFQFALYCGFKEIIIVGCDCTRGQKYNTYTRLNKSMVGNWKTARQFANTNYPSTKISVMRPINLKNIFEEYGYGDKVSIAISTYEANGKGHELLNHNLNHIMKQSYEQIEIVVSDHSSDNKIKDLCFSYGGKYPIRYIHNKNNKGNSSQNTNNAWNHCTGKYIKILFMDDYLYNRYAIEKIVKTFMANPDKKWLVHSYKHTKNYKNFYWLHHPKLSHDVASFVSGVDSAVERDSHGNIVNKIGCPSCLTVVSTVKERFDESLKWYMDSELYYRLFKFHGEPIFIHTQADDAFMINVHHKNQVTKTQINKQMIKKEETYIKLKHSSASVAVITAVYGKYDDPAKHVSQSIPVDFFFFTDADVKSSIHIVDTEKYHYKLLPDKYDQNFNNSYERNKHTFNQAKFYKQQFYKIPCLKKYDYVIWLDGSIQLTCPRAIEKTINAMKKSKKGVLTWKHEMHASIRDETLASHFERYTSKFWKGQSQTYQDVDKQYEDYIRDGYEDVHGVYITCMVAWDMRHPKTKPTLDLWYMQTLIYTTQDQISFPYVIWKTNNEPHILPDENISGNTPHESTSIFKKRRHK